MAPVPKRGARNESAYITHVIERLAQAYGVDEEKVADITTSTAQRVFGLKNE